MAQFVEHGLLQRQGVVGLISALGPTIVWVPYGKMNGRITVNGFLIKASADNMMFIVIGHLRSN